MDVHAPVALWVIVCVALPPLVYAAGYMVGVLMSPRDDR